MRIARVALDDSRWREFVASHPDAGPFHLPQWSQVIAECYGFDPFVLAAQDSDGVLIAGVPCTEVKSLFGAPRWVSLPFTDACRPLLLSDVALADVMAAVSEYVFSSPARQLEVRWDLPEAADTHAVTAGYVHTLSLPSDPTDLHPNKGHRNSRNRARRRGIRITQGTSAEDVAAFYRLHTLTRRRHGVPVQPRRFFDLVHSRLIAQGHGFVATATLDDQVLAAGIYLGHNGVMVAKYYASDPAHQDSGAGYLIDWETMVAACQAGYHTYDMGRSDPDADGLRLYKASWGATETPLTYTHVSHQPPPSAQAHVGTLPREIIRRSPQWVCRALGEVLYRWTA